MKKYGMILNTLKMKRMNRSNPCTTSANTAVCTTSSSETSKSLKGCINNKLRKNYVVISNRSNDLAKLIEECYDTCI